MIPSCLTTLVQQLRDRFECFMHGPLVEETIADTLHADLRAAQEELKAADRAHATLENAISVLMRQLAEAEQERDGLRRDLNDIWAFRKNSQAIWEHPSFGGDQ